MNSAVPFIWIHLGPLLISIQSYSPCQAFAGKLHTSTLHTWVLSSCLHAALRRATGTENRPTKGISSGASVGPQDASELLFYRWVLRPILSEYLPIAEIYADPALLGAASRGADQVQSGVGSGVQTGHCWGRNHGCRPCTAGSGVESAEEALLGVGSGVQTLHCWGWCQGWRPGTAGGGVRGGDQALLGVGSEVQTLHCWGWG